MFQLNGEQKAAIETGAGVFQVIAGPGSGKTEVLVQRYRRLHQLRYHVVGLTFTKKAAAEMWNRSGGGDFRTIASLQYRILRQHGEVTDFDLETFGQDAVRLLKKECGQRYDFVLVDEAQDCSEDDWKFIDLLSDNIFAVGDAMQCVYGFRDSRPDLFLNMKSMFPESKTLYLGRNYRSTREIVDFCKKIAPIRGELMAHLCSENERGDPVDFFQYNNNVAEAENIIQMGSAIPGTVVVLARTNYQLDVFRKLNAPPTLELSTIHAAKGKEWDNVFVIGCQEGLIPFKDGDQDEEGRILFVAASRARKRLFLSSYGTTSRFLK